MSGSSASPPRAARNFAARMLWLLVCAAACTACSHDPRGLHAKDVSGILPPLKFTLVDSDGKVTADSFRGKATLLYFGYTGCPDVCPTTLSRLSQALRLLGPEADSVRVLFVSVDPQRDSPQVLQHYAAAFGPEVIGLTGTDAQLTDVTKRFRVAYRRDAPDAEGNYAVYHSSAVFAFDRTGRVRLLMSDSETSEQLAQDLRFLTS